MKNKTYSPPSKLEISALASAALLAFTVTLAYGGPPVVGGAPIGAAGNLGMSFGQGLGNARMGAAGAGAIGGPGRGFGAGSAAGVFSGPGHAGVGFDGVESIGIRQERLRAQTAATTSGNADAHASVMGEARGRSVATLAAGGASASLNTAETVHAIQSQAMASREQLLAELHTRVDASAKAMTTVRESGAKLDGEAKANFKAASADVKAKEKALNKSMKAAEKADADTWVTARAKLASDFDAYAAAVAHAETVSRAEAKPADKPNG